MRSLLQEVCRKVRVVIELGLCEGCERVTGCERVRVVIGLGL